MGEMIVSQVDAGASTAYLVETQVVNWVLLQEGTDLTLIDGGYPGRPTPWWSPLSGSVDGPRTSAARCSPTPTSTISAGW